MTSLFNRGMAKVTELTNAGKLTEATAMIQSLLGKGGSPMDASPDGDTVEGEFTRLEPAGPAAAPPAAAASPRTGLRETLRRIAAGGMPERDLARGPVQVPPGGQFLSLTHSSDHGTRVYRLYVPASRPAGVMPLIVMLHGCTQTPEDFAIGTGMNALAEAQGFLVAYPAQPSGANANKCWNWFRPEDQGRDRGEPALIAGLTRDILRDHGGDPARVYIAGLSAGGAAAAIVGQAYPDLFGAVGVHSGLPVGAARDIPNAFAAMRGGAAGQKLTRAVPTITFHGTADNTVNPGNGIAVAEQVVRTMPGLVVTEKTGKARGGRAWSQTSHSRAKGPTMCEEWRITGAGHAWSGGQAAGSYTDPAGPDASAEMVRFFLQHRAA